MFARSTVVVGILSAALFSRISADEPKSAESPKLEIQLKDVKKQATLVIKKTVKREEIGAALGEIFPKIFAYLGANNIKPSSAPMAKYKVVGDKFEMEGGVIVPDGTKGEGEIVVGELPAGKAAFAVHVGPYEKLPKTYQALAEWLKAKGDKPTDIGWEIYVSDPGQAKPEETKTEVYLMVDSDKKDK
jgi:AraC family transcriptional regulator